MFRQNVNMEINLNNKALQYAASMYMRGILAIDEQFALSELSKLSLKYDLLGSGTSVQEVFGAEKQASEVRYYTTNGILLMDDIAEGEEIPPQTVAIYPINGAMQYGGDLCTYGMKDLSNRMYEDMGNPFVLGGVLDVNSGGGEATAGQVINSTVKAYKKVKPISTFELNSHSAANLATTNANYRVMAGDMGSQGSVGALLQIPKWYREYIATGFDTIYSTSSDSKNLAWRKYIFEGDISMLQEEITAFDKQFMNEVLSSRKRQINAKGLKTNSKEVKEYLEGGTFPSKHVVKIGFADSVGTLQDSINYVLKNANSGNSNKTTIVMATTTDKTPEANLEEIRAELKLSQDTTKLAGQKTLDLEASLKEIQTKLEDKTKALELSEARVADLEKEATNLENAHDSNVTLEQEKKDLTDKVATLEGEKTTLTDSNKKLTEELEAANLRLSAIDAYTNEAGEAFGETVLVQFHKDAIAAQNKLEADRKLAETNSKEGAKTTRRKRKNSKPEFYKLRG